MEQQGGEIRGVGARITLALEERACLGQQLVRKNDLVSFAFWTCYLISICVEMSDSTLCSKGACSVGIRMMDKVVENERTLLFDEIRL